MLLLAVITLRSTKQITSIPGSLFLTTMEAKAREPGIEVAYQTVNENYSDSKSWACIGGQYWASKAFVLGYFLGVEGLLCLG